MAGHEKCPLGEKSPNELARDIETAKRHELALAAVGIQPPAPEQPKPEKADVVGLGDSVATTYAKVHCKFATQSTRIVGPPFVKSDSTKLQKLTRGSYRRSTATP